MFDRPEIFLGGGRGFDGFPDLGGNLGTEALSKVKSTFTKVIILIIAKYTSSKCSPAAPTYKKAIIIIIAKYTSKFSPAAPISRQVSILREILPISQLFSISPGSQKARISTFL